MKLQIIELRCVDLLEGTELFKYILELNERIIIITDKVKSKLSAVEAYKLIICNGFNQGHSFNLEDYCLLGIIPELDMKVIFEQEVPNTYLKDLYIESRKIAIDDDFK